MEQGMYQEIENQRNDRIRILRKLLLGGLLFLLGWSAITGMEYHSYKEKLALAAQMTREETDGQTPFAILKEPTAQPSVFAGVMRSALP